MTAIDEFFDKMKESREFTENVVSWMCKLFLESKETEVNILLTDILLLQAYYGIYRPIPRTANHVRFSELSTSIESKIRSMEGHDAVHAMLQHFSKELPNYAGLV
jgi:hypothetical protein